MSLVLMLLFLSVLIIAHELGHFWVARRCGVKVERFGLGLPMGPTLWSKKIGETEYCLHAVLFGGYVSFPDDSPESPVPKDSPERFENQPIVNRAAIAVAGITVNAILAIVLMASVLIIWGAPQYKVLAGAFVPELKTGDAAVAQQAIARFKKQQPLARAGVIISSNDIALTGTESTADALIAFKSFTTWQPETSLRLISTTEPVGLAVMEPPAAVKAGMRVMDEIVAIEGNRVQEQFDRSLMFVKNSISQHPNDTIGITVASTHTPNEQRTLNVTPNAEGRIGISMLPQEAGRISVNVIQSVVIATQFLWGIVIDNFTALGQLFTGQLPMNQLSGPIGIVNQGAQVIEHSGIEKGLVLTAMISMILAVMNLLPIPPLDGSHLLFLGIEAAKGSPLSKKYQEILVQVGFVGLMGLMVFVVFNDLVNLFQNPLF